MHITLIGFKASGKSTLGAALAGLLQREFIDTDQRLEQLHTAWHGHKSSTRDIYTSLGEGGFRHLESAAIASLLWTTSAVVATGGGAILHENNRSIFKHCCLTVFVDTALPLLQERLHSVQTPLFQEESLMALYANRRPLYVDAADIVFPVTHSHPPHHLAAELHQHIQEHTHG